MNDEEELLVVDWKLPEFVERIPRKLPLALLAAREVVRATERSCDP
jgi:hypothetical protein